MNLRALLLPAPPETPASVGLLLLRAVAGLAMTSHGWGKMQNPFLWLGGDTPAVFQFLAAVAEFFGGLALAAGLLSVIASFGIACTMVVAMYRHVSQGDPFGKWELATLYLVISVLVLLGGPGRFSLDALVRARLEKR
ncbi:MAG: DoxX family protein [Myxococcales bacterium]|nr:DoxX family protein [Myxococcales bacterium]